MCVKCVYFYANVSQHEKRPKKKGIMYVFSEKIEKERIYASLMSSSQAFGKPKLNERSMPASGYNA